MITSDTREIVARAFASERERADHLQAALVEALTELLAARVELKTLREEAKRYRWPSSKKKGATP